MRRLATVAMLLVAGSCGNEAPASAVDRVTLELSGVEGIPPVRIVVPHFGASWSTLPAAHVLLGGSARDGFMTEVIVRPEGSCSSPSCERERIGEQPRSQTCTADDGTTVYVEHRIDGTSVCCIASWKAYEPLTDERRRIAAAIESACSKLE